jgi:hypothetical protein
MKPDRQKAAAFIRQAAKLLGSIKVMASPVPLADLSEAQMDFLFDALSRARSALEDARGDGVMHPIRGAGEQWETDDQVDALTLEVSELANKVRFAIAFPKKKPQASLGTETPAPTMVQEASPVQAGHMQPSVFRSDALVIETAEGTSFLPASEVGGSDAAAVAAFLDMPVDDIIDVEHKTNQWFAHLTAPGYMDQTDLGIHRTEKEAWSDLIQNYPEAFTWAIDGSTVGFHGESDAAAEAMQENVQSIGSSHIERDGSFCYAPTGAGDDDMADMMEQGHSESEAADEAQRLEDEIADELEAAGFEVQRQ